MPDSHLAGYYQGDLEVVKAAVAAHRAARTDTPTTLTPAAAFDDCPVARMHLSYYLGDLEVVKAAVAAARS